MSHPKLRKVASSPALREWAVSCPESAFAGTSRVETQHAIYLFRNGSCFAVSGRGRRAGTTSTDPAVDDEARRRHSVGGILVSRNWRPDARAVLFGKVGLFGGMRLALTSPVETFTLYGDGNVEPTRPPAFDRSPTGSLTRVGVAVPSMG
jgi:hypothetical protein